MSGPLVVAHGRIGGRAGTRSLPTRWTLGDVYAAALEGQARTVLVHDAGGWDGVGEGAAGVTVETTGDQSGSPWRFRVSTPRAFLCGGGGPGGVGGQVVDVVMLEDDLSGYAGPFEGLDARELVDVLGRLEGLLGVPWSDSVGRTSERLMLSTHPRSRGGTPLDREPFTPAPAEEGALELDWQSWRWPLPAGRVPGYVHVYDASAQHLGAMLAVELGHGRPVHHERPPFDRSRFGLWRIAGGLDSVGVPSMPDAPAPWLPHREWYTTETMTRALEVGDGLDVPDVAEAWIWPSRSRFLRGYAERLRDARRAATLARDAARERVRDADCLGDVTPDWIEAAIGDTVTAGVVLDAVKALYSRQAGRFQMTRAEGSGWHRPEWGHAIRAKARCNLHRRLEKLGAVPLAIATDALVFVDDEPDPAVFADRIRLPLGRQLGAYTHEGTVAVSESLKDALEGLSAVKMLQAIGEGL